MKILIIGYMHPKYDKRVFRTAKSLSKENKVIYQYWTKDYESDYTEGNISYIPIQYTKNTKYNLLIKLKHRKKLDRKILNIVNEYDYDILYMHHFLTSMPIMPFKIAKRRNKKIIFDIHEYHPQNFIRNVSFFGKERVLWQIFKTQLKLSDKLIFVSEEMQKDVYKKLNISKKYLIQKNYAELSVISKDKIKEVSFVGKTNRSLDDEKRLLKELFKHGFGFKIIGMDSDYFKDIEHIHTSFLPYNEMMKELSKSLFSLISFNTVKNRSYKNDVFGLSHKFYDSIAAETPVIVKNTFVSMAKEVEKYKIGIIIDPSNIEESVNKVLKAYENYDELIKNIRRYKEKFVWDNKKEKEFINFVLS